MKKTYEYPQIAIMNIQTSDSITTSQTLNGFTNQGVGDGDNDRIDIGGLV